MGKGMPKTKGPDPLVAAVTRLLAPYLNGYTDQAWRLAKEIDRLYRKAKR